MLFLFPEGAKSYLKEKVDTILERFDKNGDNRISKLEFLRGGRAKRCLENGPHGSKIGVEHFMALDQNGNGFLEATGIDSNYSGFK